MSTPNLMGTPNLIADRTYRNYDGPMRTLRAGWWVIAQSVIRTNIKKIGFWMPVLMIVLIHLFFGLFFFLNHNVTRAMGDMAGGGGEGFGRRGGGTFTYAACCYLCVTESWLMVFIEALIIGAGCIAADHQANALLVYLARPLTKLDYLAGKWFGVFSLLWCVSAIPTFLIYIFLLTSYYDEGFWTQNPYLLPRLFVASLIAPVLNASLVVGFSALSKSGRLAGAAYAGFYFVVSTLTYVSGIILGQNAFVDLDNEKPGAKTAIVRAMTIRDSSVGGVADGLAMNLMRVKHSDHPIPVAGGHKRRQEAPLTWPLLALGGAFVLVPLVLAHRKIRAVEIISG
jgi:ABC-2 type transport system permease protein